MQIRACHAVAVLTGALLDESMSYSHAMDASGTPFCMQAAHLLISSTCWPTSILRRCGDCTAISSCSQPLSSCFYASSICRLCCKHLHLMCPAETAPPAVLPVAAAAFAAAR
jgi:hypothetical protein